MQNKPLNKNFNNCLILIGAPLSGKSTFIKTNHLEPFTLNADKLRQMAGAQLFTNAYIDQTVDNIVWPVFEQLLHQRMILNEFIVIDNTNADPQHLVPLVDDLNKHGYNVFFKFFDVDKQELLNRNANAIDRQRLPVSAIDSFYDKIAKMHAFFDVHPDFKTNIVTDDWEKLLHFQHTLNLADDALIFGDLQADVNVYDQVLNLVKTGRQCIFLGDFFDQHKINLDDATQQKTFDFLCELATYHNVKLIFGNHELTPFRYFWFQDLQVLNYTLPETDTIRWLKAQDEATLQKFKALFGKFSRYEYDADKKILLSHAGLAKNSISDTNNTLGLCGDCTNNLWQVEHNGVHYLPFHYNFSATGHKTNFNVQDFDDDCYQFVGHYNAANFTADHLDVNNKIVCLDALGDNQHCYYDCKTQTKHFFGDRNVVKLTIDVIYPEDCLLAYYKNINAVYQKLLVPTLKQTTQNEWIIYTIPETGDQFGYNVNALQAMFKVNGNQTTYQLFKFNEQQTQAFINHCQNFEQRYMHIQEQLQRKKQSKKIINH